MAEDITARILLSVEYADAVKKCKDVEVGITEVTEARERDVEATKTTKTTSSSNARAMEKEAEAAKKVAKATKEKADAQLSYEEAVRKAAKSQGMSEEEWHERAKRNAEISAKAQADFNRKFNERMSGEEAKAAADANPERSAVVAELKERRSVMKEVQIEQSRMAEIANAALDEQIKEQRILVAELRKQLAIEKEIALQHKLNEVRDQLNDPNVRKDLPKVNELTKLRDKYERQSTFNSQEILTAEQNLRRLKNPIKEVNKQVEKSTSVFGKAARGIGRSISAIARIGGRGMGMEIPTEGLEGPGAAFMAGAAAIAGVSMLIRSAMQFRDTEENAEYDVRQREIANLKETTERIAAETAKRKQGIDALNEFTQKEELTNSERLKQAQILKDLNYALEGMRVNVDATSGRILNMGEIGWQVKERDTKREIEQLEREKKKQQREIDIQNELEKPGIGSEIATHVLLSTIPKADLIIAVKPIFNSIQGAISKAWNNTFDKEATLRREQKKQNAQDELLSIQDKQNEKKKSINEIAQKEYWEKQNAGLETRIKTMRETSQALAYSMNVDGDAWRIRQKELERYSEKDLKALQEKTSDKALKKIQAMPKKTIEEQKKYNKALSEYNENMLQRQHIEQKRAEYANKEREIRRTIDDLRKEISLQDMLNSGKSKEADIERKVWEMEKKVTREGWSPEQAKEWASLKAKQEEKAARKALSSSIAAITRNESYKIRQTSTAAVMANSLEGLRLQSRQLLANTPEQKMLAETQHQSKTLDNTLRAIENVYKAISKGIKVETRAV